jgi:beta-lactamase class A
MFDRRQFLVSLPLAGLANAAGAHIADPPSVFDKARLADAVAAAEAATGGRVGFAVAQAGDRLLPRLHYSHRGGELFPMASTFKMLLAGAILAKVDAGKERLDRAVPVKAGDILANSPVSQKHVGGTATVAELAEATVIYSDNTAANLLLPAVGGPAGLTAWLRGLGDKVTRLDRIEPMMSEARPGDPRDSTSPDAIIATWQKLLFGNVLQPASRVQLTQWLIANTTGGTRLRAGLPKDWIIGDKTGTGGNNSVNDIAVAWRQRNDPAPLLIACFLNGGTAPDAVLYKAHADLARAVAATLTAPMKPALG